MSLEWFSRLKEYESLSKQRLASLSAVKEQELRMEKLSQKKDESIAHLSKMKTDHAHLQQKLHEAEKKILTQNEQKDRWINQGGSEEKRSLMEIELNRLEAEGFRILEELEENELGRKEIQTFLEGLQLTIKEIHAEVLEESEKLKKEISNLDLRLEGILEVLPTEFRDVLLRIVQKKLAHGPFTRIESGSCFFCRYKISRMEESEIDMQKLLKTCPQCTRIFIPYGT